jgi:hypothetical protein
MNILDKQNRIVEPTMPALCAAEATGLIRTEDNKIRMQIHDKDDGWTIYENGVEESTYDASECDLSYSHFRFLVEALTGTVLPHI